jgi:Protein of unknown function (DUF1592)/Protein of unknown function (DUF1588)/Protein of unknown function (DUF1587)/Protein of unknown function (DUF1585)/Protein of unknown function (DUF1595)/Planctomycete cytochrome C
MNWCPQRCVSVKAGLRLWPASLTLAWLSLVSLAPGLLAADRAEAELERRFNGSVRPFVETYCLKCHGSQKPKGDFDLSPYTTLTAVTRDFARWEMVLDKLQTGEMPPEKAKEHPAPMLRDEVAEWVRSLRQFEAAKHAGDPGLVLARRLSNAEYNYTIRDLTGVDMKPAREFPADPANTAGFDNSGETLVMSPTLLKKQLAAAREVASHLYLKPEGFAFAPNPMLVETDRDQFCVMQIINFYHRQNTDYADYFEAAWRFKHRTALGRSRETLAEIAAAGHLSAKYLTTLWSTLEGAKEEIGPLATLQGIWRSLPPPDRKRPAVARPGCQRMREFVTQLRLKVEPRFLNLTAGKIDAERQPMMMWKNIQYATHRRTFDPAQLQVAGEARPMEGIPVEPGTKNVFGPGRTPLIHNAPGDPDLTVPPGQRARYEAAFAKFCSVFPDMFYKEERGRNYFDTTNDRGRYLSAGFHNLMGYFRDDQPLYELILDEQGQATLDELWHELDFVASANIRTYIQFYLGGNQEGRVIAEEEMAKPEHAEDREITSEAKIRLLEDRYLADAEGGGEIGIRAIRDFFKAANDGIRWVEKARIAAEPGHLEALLKFAARAYRRPLSREEREDLLAYYKSARTKDGLDHEAAMRESIVAVLMSPDLCYRIDLAQAGTGIHPLSDYDLASRLSYFLWSTLPDDELLTHAAAGDLHQPKVIAAQARRMLHDPRIRALAVEFGGNWLDFRRFSEIGTVDVRRFPSFTGELREAMFEEPVRFLLDMIQGNRPILDCLYARDTFVNPVLARHYGIPLADGATNEWVRVPDANRYGRGGVLPMAAFLTKNAPGLRTSPVKRGNWVVKNVLGERIPPPPAVVPELPRDEAKSDLPLRAMLERHRADANCAACHARFDALGLVFEGFGPVGERRERDLAGRPVDARATFPDGGEGEGVEGLKSYIRNRRQDDFVNNFCGKLASYALGRSPILSDELMIREMRRRLVANGYRLETVIESIVTSRQFLTKRGRDEVAADRR